MLLFSLYILTNSHSALKVIGSYRDAPPCNFTLKIQSFSSFSKKTIERFDTGVFKAAGYKWKLSLYPNGDKNRDGKDHISLYLVITDTDSLIPGWEVNASFKFFLFDQIRNRYLMLGDVGGRSKRFDKMKTDWGFSKLIPIATFNDPTNAFLVNDTCVLGVEVLICDREVKASECLSMMKEPTAVTHKWKIKEFIKYWLEGYYSKVFVAGHHKWILLMYPKSKSGISLYLIWTDSPNHNPGRRVYVDFVLSIRNQNLGKTFERKAKHCFCSSSRKWGWRKFIGLRKFNEEKNGYLVKDTCIVEAEVTVLGFVDKS